jgi:hypothetical protein
LANSSKINSVDILLDISPLTCNNDRLENWNFLAVSLIFASQRMNVHMSLNQPEQLMPLVINGMNNASILNDITKLSFYVETFLFFVLIMTVIGGWGD